MLTPRQNLLETIRGGSPDRFVNQFDAFDVTYGCGPIDAKYPRPAKGGERKDGWGVTYIYPENTVASYPKHGEGFTVIEDVTRWRDFIRSPELEYTDEEWAPFVKQINSVDRNEKLAAVLVFGGIFEQLHYLLGMENCLLSFYTEPEAMHELIDYIADWKIRLAKEVCGHMHPEVVIAHDDWGSQTSTFLSPEMFGEFIAPALKRVYNAFRENGAEIIVHHSDSYAATLVPYMIDMGVDIWQGCMSTNNIPELIEKYGGKLTCMGGIDSGKLDREDVSPEEISAVVRAVCTENGKGFIPCLTMGEPESLFSGVYDAVTAEIDRMSAEMF